MSVWNSTGLLVLPVLPQEKIDSTEVLEHVFGGHTEMLVPESNAVDGRPSGQRKQDSLRRACSTSSLHASDGEGYPRVSRESALSSSTAVSVPLETKAVSESCDFRSTMS